MPQRENNSLRAIFASQRQALSLALRGAPLAEILSVLLRCLEEQYEGRIRGSILLANENGELRHCAAPSLPTDYCHAVAGSCGTSTYRRESVLVSDIATDPLWHDYRDVALKHNLRSCLSTPIFSQDGAVLGSLAIYGDEVGDPSPIDQELVLLVTQTAAVMIERQYEAGAKKRIEAEAERARRQLVDVFDQAPVAICVLDGPDHTISFINSAFYQIFPIDPKIIMNMSARHLLQDERTSEFLKLLDQVYQSGQSFVGTELPSPKQLPDGTFTTVYLNCNYHPKRNARDQVDGIISVFIDVTEQVLARQALERAKLEVDNERENFENLFTQTPEIVCILKGAEHRFEFVNEAHTRMLGADVLGLTLMDAQPESVEIHGIIDQVFATGVTAQLRELPVTIRGQTRHLNITYSARMDSDGVIDGVMFLGADVSEQIAIRNETENQQRWLESILNRLPISLFLMDPEAGRVIFANETAERHLGRSIAGARPTDNMEVIQMEVFDKYGHALAMPDFPSSRALRGENMQNEEFYVTSILGRYHVSVHSAVLQASYGHRRTSLMLMQDISPIKAAQAAAEAANMAKSSFLANMSHEIRTPLGAIMGFLELMKSPQASREDINGYIQVIDRNSDQLLRLIDDILDLSKVEAGKMFFEKIEFSLRELLVDFSKMMAFKAEEKGIDFRIRLATQVPERIMSDPTRLRQILANIVGNAIKFTDEGHVTVDVAFFEDELRMTVTDTGRGISAEQSQKLFRPFAQADSSTTRAFGGTGLGLVLSRRLANAMGGDFILRRSDLGIGSVFYASIKVDIPAESEMMDKGDLHELERRSILSTEAAVLSGLSILVVEDSLDNQALLKIMLTRLGAEIAIGSDGQEGVNLAKGGPYDLVLMDVQMPVMDGHEATRRLRKAAFNKPIIALTAHAMKEERERCLASGFTDFLTKPIHHDSLVQMLLRYRDVSRDH